MTPAGPPSPSSSPADLAPQGEAVARAARRDARDHPVSLLPGVGPARARLLAGKGLGTVGDLLTFFPIRIEDRSHVVAIAAAPCGEAVTLRARVSRVRAGWVRRGGRAILRARLDDDTGSLEAVWFHQPYLAHRLPHGAWGSFRGKIRRYRGVPTLANPEFEIVSPAGHSEGEGTAASAPRPGDPGEPRAPGRSAPPGGMGLVPIYAPVEGLGPRFLRKLLAIALDRTAPGEMWELPPGAPPWKTLRAMHRPESLEAWERARRELAREELFLFELGLAMRRESARRRPAPRLVGSWAEDVERFLGGLPFPPTPGQRRAIAEVARDLGAGRPMRRLLQGEVGSGKTVVALAACFLAIRGGRQAVLLAPTEVLAQQHARHAAALLRPLGIEPWLVVGGLPAAERRRRREALASGRAPLAVGTHALLEPGVRFARLGLVVVDEQHRFGVDQRARILAKASIPHALVLTATPIPRTLALTLYGDLDGTILEGLPPGRHPVETRLVAGSQLEPMWEDLRREAQAGHGAYCIYPLVEESEDLDLLAATEQWRFLRQGPLRGLEVGLLHGRMSLEEKDDALAAFCNGRTPVLVSTVVVEVGVDQPRATRIAIFDAERFGLTQLHQLRGRVGRGRDPSRCYLVTRRRDEAARERLLILETCADGRRIAEEDLRRRGAGDVFGVRQHGELPLRVARPLRDLDLLEEAREKALRVAARDPHLEDPAHRGWAVELRRRYPAAARLGGAA